MTKPCPGPDPEPRKPKLQVPPGSCDTHAHVFGPSTKYPYHSDRDYTPPDAPLAEFERMLRILGIERAVLVQPSVYGTDNSAQLDAIAAATLELRGVAVVEEDISDRELAAAREVRPSDESSARQSGQYELNESRSLDELLRSQDSLLDLFGFYAISTIDLVDERIAKDKPAREQRPIGNDLVERHRFTFDVLKARGLHISHHIFLV